MLMVSVCLSIQLFAGFVVGAAAAAAVAAYDERASDKLFV